MHNEPGKTMNNQPGDRAVKADDFDKEKAATDKTGNNVPGNKASSSATSKDDVLKEQKETD